MPNAGANGTDAVAEKEFRLAIPPVQEVLGYDPVGNLSSDGFWELSWNAAGRLIQMTRKPEAIAEPGLEGDVLQFVYDADGRRTQKIRTRTYDDDRQVVEESRVLWSGWLPVLEERFLDGLSRGRRFFVWGADVSGSFEGAGGIGGLLAIREEDLTGEVVRTLLPVQDGLGNITAVLNAADGSVVAQYDMGPFGEPLGEYGEVDACPFRFQSKWWDAETELSYFGYRYYSPRLGRWLSRDPLGEAGGINLYAYCGNDPINRHDPTGLSPGGHSGRAFIRARVRDPKRRDAMLREFDELWDDSQRYGYLGPVALSMPLAAVALPEVAALGGDLALKSYVTLQTSSVAQGALKLLGAYHLYNFATDADYRGQTISLDGGTGFSSVYFAADDLFSTGRSLLSFLGQKLSPTWNPMNYRLVAKGVGTFGGGIEAKYVGPGPQDIAAQLQVRAQELQQMRLGWMQTRGTTAAIQARNQLTGETRIFVATEGVTLPVEWSGRLGSAETFVEGLGHAEHTIVNSFGAEWQIVAGGTSRNICLEICAPLLEGTGVTLGGSIFRGQADKSPYRMFWSPE